MAGPRRDTLPNAVAGAEPNRVRPHPIPGGDGQGLPRCISECRPLFCDQPTFSHPGRGWQTDRRTFQGQPEFRSQGICCTCVGRPVSRRGNPYDTLPRDSYLMLAVRTLSLDFRVRAKPTAGLWCGRWIQDPGLARRMGAGSGHLPHPTLRPLYRVRSAGVCILRARALSVGLLSPPAL